MNKCKIILIGFTNVGKTSIIQRYTRNSFESYKDITIGVEFMMKKEYNFFPDKNIDVCLWDTGGMERYNAMTKSFFKNVNGVIIVYDINSEYSFTIAKQWVKDVKKLISNKTVQIQLMGNKIDLEKRCVSFEEVCDYAEENNIILTEVSAKSGQNVIISFRDLIFRIIFFYKKENDEKSININEYKNKEIKNRDKCYC